MNQERKRGTPLSEAIRTASHRPLRAFLLTTLTTVAGLAPMVLGAGGYSKISSPFATSMCWGLTSSTIVTLVVTPHLYHVARDLRSQVAPLLRLKDRLHGEVAGSPAVASNAPALAAD